MFDKFNSTTIYVVEVPNNSPSGIILNHLDEVNILLRSRSIQGNSIVYIAFINLGRVGQCLQFGADKVFP